MANEATRLWPLVAMLGAAATSAHGTQAVLQQLLEQLGRVCGARAELWEALSEPSGAVPAWQLRAAESGAPVPLRGIVNVPPVAQVAQAATMLRTIETTQPTLTLTLPILAFGRSLAVLHLRAAGADTILHSWRADLEQFTPILGLYLHAAELNEALASGTLRDRLTGIANQAQLHDHLERELARARRARRSFALLMIALDRFDALATDLGLPLRDRVMQSLAVLLRDACRDGDVIGRYGTDRFLALLPESTGQGAQTAAQRHLDHFYRRPIVLPTGATLYLDVSIGIALFPVDGLTLGELVENATTALREAQRLGGKRAVAA